MGGSGSGRWYRWNKKTVVEDGLSLDIRKLVRENLAIPDRHTSGTLNWCRTSDGVRTASMGFEADLSASDHCWIRLHYNHNPTLRWAKMVVYMPFK